MKNFLDTREKEIRVIEISLYNEEISEFRDNNQVVLDLDDSGEAFDCISNRKFQLRQLINILPGDAEEFIQSYVNSTNWNENQKWFYKYRQVNLLVQNFTTRWGLPKNQLHLYFFSPWSALY